jgi:glutamyl-Q tRNA(Asp) synthetase
MTHVERPRYVGRFAPSPTGPLHLGSLTTAVASYLHARQHDGEWLLRIDDLDPLRTVPGSADSILRTLEALGLLWDRKVQYQHDRREHYRAAASRLRARRLAYYCVCTRRQLREEHPPGELGSRYPGTCRNLDLTEQDAALRVRIDAPQHSFADIVQGPIVVDVEQETGDFIIWRRDDVPAYHLAVVCDDHALGVTTIIRGCDLLKASALHLHLARLLGYDLPVYGHVPIVTTARGEKLSKRHIRLPIEALDIGEIAWNVMLQLGTEPPGELRRAPPGEIWAWARQHWRLEALHGRITMPLDERVSALVGGMAID